MQKSACTVLGTQPLDEGHAISTLGRAQCIGIPFGGIAVAGADEGGFPTHRQAYIIGNELGINFAPQSQNIFPLSLGIGPRHTRRFVDPLDGHGVRKVHFCLL